MASHRDCRLSQRAVSAAIGASEGPLLGRMNTLDSSSGIVATLAQKVCQTPFRCRYCSTFET